MSVILHTPRLTLDELETDRDADFILALLNEPGFLENIGDRGVRDLAGARRYIEEGPRASYAGYGYGLWRATERDGGRPVGLCGVLKRDGLKDPNLGYAFLASVWGRGYASEAARACLDHARRALRLGRIVAITTPGNTASQAVLKKIGLKAAGVVRRAGNDEESAYFVSEG
ncbi:GNAT family N-acetyltransferase [Phenylobacterium sp.]|uniref:GNAT family N-acetyltransferase n=1 Tax=Phenylobacterium sp. TaxID=1871053 RepID=UPI0025DEC146|nr:GNAT family N-acetyltransferase [Phenylobacterium sp.]